MAGAEVVEPERDAELAELAHRLERDLRVAHDAALRDLERKPLGA